MQLESKKWVAFPDFDETFMIEADTQEEAFCLMCQRFDQIKDKFIEIDLETNTVKRIGNSPASIIAQMIKEKVG